MNHDKRRLDDKVAPFVRGFFDAGKPVTAICHGPWLLINAGVAAGRRLTAWPSLRTDLRNAGAEVVDEQVVVDRGLVTSRKPGDIPAFNKAVIDEFAKDIATVTSSPPTTHGSQRRPNETTAA
jgi:protease I